MIRSKYMGHNSFLLAAVIIGLIFWVPATHAQTLEPNGNFKLSAQDEQHLMQDDFQVYKKVSAIPDAVKHEFSAQEDRSIKAFAELIRQGEAKQELVRPQTLKQAEDVAKWHYAFLMADPGKPYNFSDVIDPKLPGKCLDFIALTKDYCLLHWDVGGFAPHSGVALFRLAKGEATLIWSAVPDHSVKNITEMRDKIQKHRYNPENVKAPLWFI